MNYFEFLSFFNLAENAGSWNVFVKYREVADVKGENEAIKQFNWLK